MIGNKISGKLKSLTLNTLIFLLGSIGSKIISFVMLPLYTYVLSKSEYGTIDLLNTIVQLMIPILTLNIHDAVLRFSLDEDCKKEDAINVAVRINLLSQIALGTVLVVLKLTALYKVEWSYIAFLFFAYMLQGMNASLGTYVKAVGRTKIYAIGGIVNTLISALTCVFFLVVIPLGVNGYLLAVVLGNAANMLVWTIGGKVIPQLSSSDKGIVMKKMMRYSVPMIFSSLAWWVISASDRYFVTKLIGIDENGVYSVAYKVPTIIAAVQMIFYNAWSVSAIKEFDENDSDGFIGRIYNGYSFLSVAICLGLILLNKPLASILYLGEFYEAWRYVPVLLVATMFNGLALFYGCLFGAAKQTGKLSLTTCIGAGINILLNFLLIPQMGSMGAAIATFIGYFVMWLLRSVLIAKSIRMKTLWPVHILTYILLCGLAIFYSEMLPIGQ